MIAFLYLRYTLPLFETSAVIQIDRNDEARSMFGLTGSFEEDNFMAKKVELIRSAVFLQRVAEKLPLTESYFEKGTILDYEQFQTSPYRVEFNIKSNSIYGVPIFVEFEDNAKCILRYEREKGKEQKLEIPLTSKAVFPEVDISLTNINYSRLDEERQFLSEKKYYFIINDPDQIIPQIVAKLNVEPLNQAGNTIMIRYQDNCAEKAAAIVNTIAEEFKSYDIEKQAESANKMLEFIDSRMDIIYDTLVKSQEDIIKFKKTYGIDSTATNNLLPSMTSRLNDYQNQLVEIELESNKLQEIEKNIKVSNNSDLTRLIVLTSGSDFRGSISSLLTSLQGMIITREKLLYDLTENSGQIKELDYQIALQKKLITESIEYLNINLNERKKEIEEKIVMYQGKLGVDGDSYNPVDLASLERISKINESYYTQLVNKKAEFQLAKAGYVSQNVILQRSAVPTQPISPIRNTIYIIAIALSLFLGMAIIVVRYVLFNNILSLNDIFKYTEISVIGLVPRYPLKIPVSQLIVDEHPRSLIAEALRSIRTNLQFLNNEIGPKIIAFSSTISGEGKTFVAINLAGVIAFSDKKVVVIDLDLRKPKIHIGFGVDNHKGMSTILSHKTEIDECIKHSSIKNLDFITAGPVPPNPSELIFSQDTDEVLKYLQTKYDFIIIDNPPVGLVTDGIKALSIADYPLYVIKANYSKKYYILDLERMVEDSKIKKISIVLNAAEPVNNTYKYGKKYSSKNKGYGYGYGYG
ncbi:MAG TPA: polysaccharide biosynthesis tyrosine autokinase, partial [Bacteroidales bacterium]|nr:polysaccharide biosynthesis tyrosine autokinase [Bacteroidales bacterium]